jgi:hypothetical protein
MTTATDTTIQQLELHFHSDDFGDNKGCNGLATIRQQVDGVPFQAFRNTPDHPYQFTVKETGVPGEGFGGYVNINSQGNGDLYARLYVKVVSRPDAKCNRSFLGGDYFGQMTDDKGPWTLTAREPGKCACCSMPQRVIVSKV